MPKGDSCFSCILVDVVGVCQDGNEEYIPCLLYFRQPFILLLLPCYFIRCSVWIDSWSPLVLNPL